MAVTLENGKTYQTVAERLREFRGAHPAKDGWGIVTTVEFPSAETVRVRAEIFDPAKRLTATGHAEERRAENIINMTSAVENAETSAIGRALFAAGYGNGEFCSADELMLALKAQAALKPAPKGPNGVREGDPWTKPFNEADSKPEQATPPATTVQQPKPAPQPQTNKAQIPALTATLVNPPLPTPPPGVQWDVQGDVVYAGGKSFDRKDTLKGIGFRWDKDTKLWKIRLAELLNKAGGSENRDNVPF